MYVLLEILHLHSLVISSEKLIERIITRMCISFSSGDMIEKKWKDAEEKLFRKLCDKSKLTYLHIDQDRKTFSSKIFEDQSKRPDYLVSIPDVGSIFIDVKVSSKKNFYKETYGESLSAFRISLVEYQRLKRLSEKTSVPVWLAYFEERLQRLLEDECYLIPLTRVEKFILYAHRLYNWTFIQVPVGCFNHCDKVVEPSDICLRCKRKICTNLKNKEKNEELVELKMYRSEIRTRG